MQTFLPYADFAKSFDTLDYKRLGKQRVETRQIYDLISGAKDNRWRNHSAVVMWRGYTGALALYHDECIKGWLRRGYNNSMPLLNPDPDTIEMPWWIGDEAMHRSHRARLIDKLESHYLSQFPDDKGFNNGKYWWPVNETKTFRII